MAGILGGLSFPSWRTGEPVSAHKAELLRQAVLRLDAVQRMPLSVFCSHVSFWPWSFQRNPVLIWRGAVTWRSSATTITIAVVWTGSVLSGDRVRVRVDNTTTDFTPVEGLNTFTISGNYPDLTVVPIDITLTSTSRGPGGYPNPSPNWPDVFVQEVSISPIAPQWSYPSVNTFGDVTETRLNNLTNQLLWLTQAYGMHIRPVNPYLHREQGNLTNRIDRIRWIGSFVRPSTHTQLRVRGHVVVTQGGQTESIDVLVNNNQIATWPIPTTIGVHSFEIVGSITAVAANNRGIVDIRQTKTAPANTVSPNFVTITDVSMIAPVIPPPSLPVWLPRQSMTYATLKSQFEALRTATANIRSAYTNTTSYWRRQYASPARTAKDEFIFDYVEPVQPHSAFRVGEAIIVYGEQAQLVRGALEYEPKDGNNPIQWRGSVETSLLSGSSAQSAILYFDTLKATPIGSLYFVRGKRLYYVAEWLGAL